VSHARADTKFPGAAQFLAVRRIRARDDGATEHEERLFVTAVPWEEMSPQRLLKLVRLHWGIENGNNWTADVILKEDSHSPCKVGNGIVIVSWLRLLAYNLVSAFRAHLPLKDRRVQSWGRAMEMLYQGFLGLRVSGEVFTRV
jgi:predicted transposase YbfD/YdcC